MNKLFALLVLAAIVVPAGAATRTVTLSVPGMNCAACPVTVKTAISRVEGVSRVAVNLDKREAVVTFDDAKASARKLMQASDNAGYPATVKQ